MTGEENEMEQAREEVLGAIREHLADRGLDAERVVPEADLLRDLDLDSLDTVELTLGIEERFGIEIADEELEGVGTIDDVVKLINGKLSVAS